MALNIKDPKTHDLARELATRRGITLTQAVKEALSEALQRTVPTHQPKLDRLMEIGRRAANLPVLDSRPANEILGYDDSDIPS